MRRVGVVERAAQGLAVLRSVDEESPRIGTRVLTEELTEVGELVDVFGPVERPYLAVSPDDGVRLASLVGRPLYARE